MQDEKHPLIMSVPEWSLKSGCGWQFASVVVVSSEGSFLLLQVHGEKGHELETH